MKFLSAPISSVASERSFKKAKEVASKKRCRLLPKNVRMLLFLKHNLRAIGYNSVRLLNKESDKCSDEDADTRISDEEMYPSEISGDSESAYESE